MNSYKTIYKTIKKFDTIVIARHIGADPDALASSISLRDIILNTFPHKKVFTVGTPTSKFRYLGILDKFKEEMYENSLLIVVDTPDRKRIDGVDPSRFSYSIKIDHHPFIEKYADYEWIDDTASSASQMIVELVFKTRFLLSKEASEKLYMGIVADTDRFLHRYTTQKTFELVSKLIKKSHIDFTGLYESMYLRPFKEIKFQGFLASNMTVTENGLAYFKITEDLLKEFDVDPATAGNLISQFNFIEEIYVWVFFSVDASSETIKTSIRSRGPIVNEIASHYNGGGHIYASGARLQNFEQVENLIQELDDACLKYKEQI